MNYKRKSLLATFVFAVGLICSGSLPAIADLSDQLYLQGKAHYQRGETQAAKQALLGYMSRDADWLANHLDIRHQIQIVIDHLSEPSTLLLSGIQVRRPAPPNLP